MSPFRIFRCGRSLYFEDVDKNRRSISLSSVAVVCIGHFCYCVSPDLFSNHQHLQPWSPNKGCEWPTRNTAKTSPREATSNQRNPSLMIRWRWDHGFWHSLSLLSAAQLYSRSFRAFEWACKKDQGFPQLSTPCQFHILHPTL